MAAQKIDHCPCIVCCIVEVVTTCKLQRQIGSFQVYNRQIDLRPNLTKHAKCMTLSVLETSLPRQRSHDTLASGI